MTYVFVVALGSILTAYGLSSGTSLPYSLGYVIGWFGIVVSVGASYFQYRDSIPYEFAFTADEWRPSSDGFSLLIPLSAHRKRKGAGATVFENAPDGYAEVICDNRVQHDGSTLIFASTPFAGKIAVR